MKPMLKLLPLVLLLMALKPMTQTDYVLNNTSLNLGSVTVSWSGGSGQVNVPSSGLYPLEAGGDITSVTIGGATVNRPDNGPVFYAGNLLTVQWPALNEVEVMTTRQTNSPSR
jgi:hypothetical protein